MSVVVKGKGKSKVAKKPTAKKATVKKAAPKKQFAGAETVVSEVADGEAGEEVVNTLIESEAVPMEAEIVQPNGVDKDAEVEFGMQFIIPTGQFQNIRVSVGIKCRCEGDPVIMDGTFDVLKNWVDTKLTGVVKEITEGG